MRQIHGMMMRPCSMNDKENEKIWQSSEFYTTENFYDEYRKHIVAMQHVTECAKIFILKNWEKVKDWKGLDVIIRDNSGKKTEYFNYVPRDVKKPRRGQHGSKTMEKMIQEWDEKDKAKHNPLETVSGVVLDPTDGDFSLTINGKDHLWIDDESVIIIANFIEEQLNDK